VLTGVIVLFATVGGLLVLTSILCRGGKKR
jgi:hypothetical protein